MRIRCLLALYFVGLAISNVGHAKDDLYSVKSKDHGITAFDLTVTEVKREPKKSFLIVPGFNDRSAAGSRWLMCAYTDLAIKRGFNYWIAIYPDASSDAVLIGFPESETENITKTLGPEFVADKVMPDMPASVDVMARFCGMRR